MKDYNQLKSEMMSRSGLSKPQRRKGSHRQAADNLTAAANKGIPNFGKPDLMDYIRGVDDFGINRALL